VISNLSNGLKITSLNDSQAIKFKSLNSDMNPFEKSDCANQDTEIPRDCRVGNRSPAAKKVALIGDSKMGHFVQPLIDYYVSKNWQVVPLVMNGCHISNPSNSFMKYCVDRSRWILKSLSETKFELVIFAEWPTLGSREYLQSIQSKVGDLILLQSNPTTTSPLKCIEPTLQFEMSCQTIPRSVVPVINNAYSLFRSLKSSNTHIIEAQKWICVELDCPYLTGDLFVTRDGNHMTYSYVRKITPIIFASLDSIKTW
jgi:hypothetical protein